MGDPVTRDSVSSARRIVLKVGSSSITNADGTGIVEAAIESLASVIAVWRGEGRQVVLVSSGAIAAGLHPLGLSKRPRDLATQQAAAAVGQGLLIHRYATAFATHDLHVAQVLLTADDVVRRGHYRNARTTLDRLLELEILPIVNENDTVATEEIRFGDNDRLAALVAHLIQADLLVLASDVDGLYDGDPKRGDASKLDEVRSSVELESVVVGGVGSGVGTGGMATKVDAAKIATAAGVPVLLCATTELPGAMSDEVGTFFHVTGQRTSSRLLWLAHASAPTGHLQLDPGAVSAVVDRRLSLLAAGITEVSGEFNAGDPVDLVDAAGKAVARGLVGYDSSEIPALLGRSTRDLGPEHQREVVHRDHLVIL